MARVPLKNRVNSFDWSLRGCPLCSSLNLKCSITSTYQHRWCPRKLQFFFPFPVVVLAFRRQFCCSSLANHASCFPGFLIKQSCVQLQWNATAGCITVLAKENSIRWTASEAMFTYPFKWISNGNLKREDQVVKNPDQHYNWNTKLENSLIRRLFICECLARMRTISMRWRGLNSWLISGRSRYLWAVFTE